MENNAIATIVDVTGQAYARNADGELRGVQAGDVLREGETVVTVNGGKVELSLSDGSPLIVSDIPEMTLTRDLLGEQAAGPDESAVKDETVEQVLAALESGDDLSDVLDPTAAGPGSSSGAGSEGHGFIRLARILEQTEEFTGLIGTSAQEGITPREQDLTTFVAVEEDQAVSAIPLPTIAVGDDLVVEGGTAQVEVFLNKPWNEAITVKFETADGIAVSGADYDLATGTLTFQPGTTSIFLDLNTIDDDLVEPDENFLVNLSNPISAIIVDSSGEVVITDNDEPPVVIEPPTPPVPPRTTNPVGSPRATNPASSSRATDPAGSPRATDPAGSSRATDPAGSPRATNSAGSSCYFSCDQYR